MLDITTEDTLTLTDACKVLPRGRNGARPQLSTLLRWVLEGVRGLGCRHQTVSSGIGASP